MDRQDPIERLTGLCYEAVHDPSRWSAFLGEYCAEVKAKIGAIYVPPIDGFASSPFVIHNTEPLERILDLLPRFAHIAPFLTRALERGLAPGVFVYSDLYSREELDQMEHYTLYMRQADLGHGLQMLVQRGEGASPPIAVGLGRGWHDPDFSEADRDLSLALFPHVRRAARLSLNHEPTPAFDPALGDAFDQYVTPSFLFRIDGKLLHANAAGRELCAQGGPLSLTADGLRCADGEADRHLKAAIARAIGFDWSWAGRVGADVVLPAGPDGALCVACVTPLGPDNPFLGWVSAVRAAVYILRGGAARITGEGVARIRSLFGLTQTEGEIAGALIAGRSLEEIAAARGVSVATVRQHTKAIFAKTDTHRQAELPRLRPLLEGPS